jgi:hypothetical protein
MKQSIKRRTLLWVFVVMLLFGVVPGQAWAEKPIEVVLDSEKVSFDVHPQIINGRTFVPFRALFERLDAKIKWDAKTQTVTARQEDTQIVLTIGKKEAMVNDTLIQLDVAPSVIEGRTMVPLRFVTETLDKKVQWDQDERIVYLHSIPKFIIKGDEGISQQTIASVQQMVEEEIVPYLEDKLPVVFSKKYTIKLHSTKESYGTNFGDQAGQYVDNTYAVARLTTIMVANYSIYSESFLQEILAHELAHVAISHMGIRHKLPLWVDEGLAERLRHELQREQPEFIYESKFDLISLIQAAEADQLGKLPQLNYDESGHVNYRTYDHYEWAIREMEKEYGFDKIMAYLLALQQKELDNETAFTETFNIEPTQFEEEIQERLAKLAEEEEQPFSVNFTIDEAFQGAITLLESAKLEEGENHTTALDRLPPGSYTLAVDPIQQNLKVISDTQTIKEIDLHHHQGHIYVEFEPENLVMYDRKVIERVSVKVKYAYGRVHYGGIHIEMEHESTETLSDETNLKGFFHINQIEQMK